MSSCGRRGRETRRKPKRRPNRYNPNNPSYAEVHGGQLGLKLTNIFLLEPQSFFTPKLKEAS